MHRFVRLGLGCLAITLFGATVASAQATRTWVSGVGDDANPCSRTAPCKTFAGAIAKTAAGGEISVLDPGGYGSVTITKSITITGLGAEAGVLVNGTHGIVISTGANDLVVLRGIQFHGGGTGLTAIRFYAGGALVVDNVAIEGFDKGIETSAGVTTVYRSIISGSRGVALSSTDGTLTVESSMITSNNVGAQATGGTIRLSDNSFYNNLTGFACGAGTLATAGNNRKAGNVGGSVPVCSPTATISIQ